MNVLTQLSDHSGLSQLGVKACTTNGTLRPVDSLPHPLHHINACVCTGGKGDITHFQIHIHWGSYDEKHG